MEGTAFEVLAASIRDGRDRVLELADESVLLGNDESEIRRGVAVLLNPDKRISAEVAWSALSEMRILSRRGSGDITGDLVWLRGTSTLGSANDMARNLSTALEERRREQGQSNRGVVSIGGDGAGAVVFDEEGKAQIALSPNADFGTFMEALEHVQRRSSVEALEPERLRGVVLSLARHYETVWRDPQAMVAWINDRRKTSGFPPVTNVGRIREEIENASRRYRSIIAATFNSFTRLECREIVTRVIDEATTSGGTLAPALVYDVIVDYQVGAAEELERGREVIAAYVERIETAIREGNVGRSLEDIVGKFEVVVQRWGGAARPMQISERSQGRQHPESVEVGWRIHGLGVQLYNEHALRYATSIRLLRLAKNVFSYIGREFDDRIERDLGLLDRAAPRMTNVAYSNVSRARSGGGAIGARASGVRTDAGGQSGWGRALGWMYFVLIAGILATAGILIVVENLGDGDSSSDVAGPSTVEFVKPRTGTERLLGMSELRWCVREEYLIDAGRKALDSNDEVSRFNAMVEDYNARCGSFRYRERDLERARQEVERVTKSEGIG